MCRGSFAVKKGKVFAVGGLDWNLRVFDGKKWRVVKKYEPE